MLKAFNSLQIVGVFAAFPLLISWLHEATFTGATVAFWTSVAGYVAFFFMMIVAVFTALESEWSGT